MFTETTVTRVSAYGRFADDLTRVTIPPWSFGVVTAENTKRAKKKPDGYFVFTDLTPAPTSYTLAVQADGYQLRSLDITLPTLAAVEVSLPAEDELFVLVTGVNVGNNQASFAALPFVPVIRSGAQVSGEGGFTAVLQEDLEGTGATFVTLDSVAGLAPGEALRIARTTRLILKPGPYYAFGPGATLVVFKVVENTTAAEPIPNADIVIDRVDGNALGTRNVGGVQLHTATLASTAIHLLGPGRTVHTSTNARGDAVFYYGPTPAITSLRVTVNKTGYMSKTDTVTLAPGQRTPRTVSLDLA